MTYKYRIYLDTLQPKPIPQKIDMKVDFKRLLHIENLGILLGIKKLS